MKTKVLFGSHHKVMLPRQPCLMLRIRSILPAFMTYFYAASIRLRKIFGGRD